MADKDVIVKFVQSIVDGRLVSNYGAAIRNEMADNGDNRGRLGVGDLLRHLVGVRLFLHLACLGIHILSLPFHSHAEHGSLRLGSTLRSLGFLVFVFVGFPTAKVHLITLHHARKGDILLLEQGAYLMQNKPRSFLRYMDIRSKLHGRDTLLAAGDKVHSNEPLAKGYLRVLEDSTNKDGEILTAVRPAEGAILTSIAMVFSAERADNILLVPTGLKDSLATLALSGKVVSEFEY